VTANEPPPSTRLPNLDPDALDDEGRAVLEEVIAGRGRLPTPFRVWLASPALARRMAPLGEFLSGASSLTRAESELVILLAAHHIHAGYVIAVHEREALEAGLPETVVRAISERRRPKVSEPRQRALVDMFEALTGPDAPSEAVFDVAVAVLGHAGVAEAMALAGYFTAVGLAMKMYAVAPPGAPAH
jgi:4-carboxymuconolactone decarboxylase